ncbi:MAG: hypothetical protein Q8R66_04085 [Methanobacteriaceae archaeon]|nr:hypothetical protein [Methanobacteriaceae archaeon]
MNNNIRKTKENLAQKKEDKLKPGYLLMEKTTVEIHDLLKKYEKNLINQKSFNMELLDDTSNPYLDRPIIRKGFYGTMTFFDKYIELLPINEGPTIHIDYKEVRKITNWNLSDLFGPEEFTDPEEYKLAVNSENFWNTLPDGVHFIMFLHNGLKYEISVPIEVNGLNYPYWFKEKHNQKLINLIKLHNKRSTQNFKDEFNIFCVNFMNCGTKMKFALKNRLEELFDIEFVS